MPIILIQIRPGKRVRWFGPWATARALRKRYHCGDESVITRVLITLGTSGRHFPEATKGCYRRTFREPMLRNGRSEKFKYVPASPAPGVERQDGTGDASRKFFVWRLVLTSHFVSSDFGGPTEDCLFLVLGKKSSRTFTQQVADV